MREILQDIGLLLLWLVPICLIGGAIFALIRKRTKPPRKRRHDRQHTSRFPYRLIAYLLLGSALLMTSWLIAESFARRIRSADDVETAVTVISVLCALAVVAFRKHIRQNMPRATDVVRNSPRRPVLYLRSFDQESLKFVDLKDEEKAQYNDFLNYAEDVRSPGFEQNIYGLIDGIARGDSQTRRT